MARKKENPTPRHATAEEQNVMGLRSAVVEQPVTETLENNYMPYAMSVIVSRAIPEIDGFKPSHRKLLYCMYKMGLLTGARTKSANIVGATMHYNPHGDSAIYDTMVRLSKGYGALLTPFVDSKGNFGKVYSRDMAWAASRYTEAKLAPICAEIFRDIDKDTVDFVPNYDNSTTEPTLLPTTFPNVLVSANMGIAVGMASNICGFNLGEVCETTIALLRDPEHNILTTLPAPDFPTGGEIVCDPGEMEALYKTDLDGVADGTYKYSETTAAQTFRAYCSSEYQSQKTIKPAAITEGEVSVKHDGNDYHVTLSGKTSFGGSVVANYDGPLEVCKVPQQTSLEYTDVSLAGMMDTMNIEVYYGDVLLGSSTELDDGNPEYPDLGTGLCFFSLTSGMTQSASAKRKDMADIALYWEKAKKSFRFQSPITMRAHLGHKAEYVFPCHTKYMKAPASFTDADFENLDATRFNVDIKESDVEIPVTTADDFQTSYVFFETGNGVKGVMRLKQYTPQGTGSYDYYGVMTYNYQTGPKLLMDIKCPAIVSNPQIR